MPLAITPDKFYLYQNILFDKLKSELFLLETNPISKVLITSIHGLDHLREGKVKAKDSGSLEFAYLLSQFSKTNFYGLNTPNILDNNYYADTPEKNFLNYFVQENGIKFILDIHTCHAVRPYDVEIGSINQKTLFNFTHLEEQLKTILNRHFFCIDNQVFKGEGSNNSETMIKFFSTKLNVPCLQIEINSALINEDDSLFVLHQKTKLLHCFCEFIRQLPFTN